MSKPQVPLRPKHPERVCWGCNKYCSAEELRCGNGTIRTQHPIELFGEDWAEWELDPFPPRPNCRQIELPEGMRDILLSS